MTANEITTYLKYAVDLESSVYRQKEALEEVRHGTREPVRARIEGPSDYSRSVKKPEIPSKRNPAAAFFKGLGVLVLSVVISVVMGIIMEIRKSPTSGSEELLTMVLQCFLIIAGVVVFIYAIGKALHYSKDNQKKMESYSRAMQEYERNVARRKADYNSEMNEYKIKVKKADEKYEQEQESYRKLTKSLSIMESSLRETKRALEQLYNKDIVFPKYRNMIAMCTIYEYFASGRCTELTGPNGAYNLYEAELRQNLIIGHLESIQNQMGQIKANQYTLYKQVERSNQLLTQVNSAMAKNIEINRMTAHCAAAAAKNTEAIKYLALIR